jgi:hypothetical protein
LLLHINCDFSKKSQQKKSRKDNSSLKWGPKVVPGDKLQKCNFFYEHATGLALSSAPKRLLGAKITSLRVVYEVSGRVERNKGNMCGDISLQPRFLKS